MILCSDKVPVPLNVNLLFWVGCERFTILTGKWVLINVQSIDRSKPTKVLTNRREILTRSGGIGAGMRRVARLVRVEGRVYQ